MDDPRHRLPVADLDQQRRPVAEVEGAPALVGSICADCGAHAFPVHATCHHCGSDRSSPGPVASEGTVYSFTTVHVSGSGPVPYTLAYVDTQDGLRVLGRLAGGGRWRIGDRVQVTRAADQPTGWAFAAAGEPR
jgi:uncharacterized OB-fold protein